MCFSFARNLPAVAPDFIDRDTLLKLEREDPLDRPAAEIVG